MKLSSRIYLSVFLMISLVFIIWGVCFNSLMNSELLDEIDDQLEYYSEHLMRQVLQGSELPEGGDRTNNEYYLTQVNEDYLVGHESIEYDSENVFINRIGEEEPARVLRTVFSKDDGTLWLLTVLTPSYEREELRSAIVLGCCLLLLGMLVFLGIVFIIVFRRTMRPLYRLLDWLEDYNLGTGSAELDNPTSISEFRRLSDAVSDCMKRIENVYDRERRFIGDASHELQTPLAICQNRIEMMMEDPRLDGTQMEELMKLQQTMSESIRLNRSLLLLSKIENRQFMDKTDVCINDIIRHLSETYCEVFASMNVRWEYEEKGMWTVQANESLMSTMTSNLLRNAFVHNIENGVIHVTVGDDFFSIANTGHEEPLDNEMLFQRFYRRERNKKGSSGLGLSIVKAICEASCLKVDYSFDGGFHVFRISS